MSTEVERKLLAATLHLNGGGYEVRDLLLGGAVPPCLIHHCM